MGATLVSAVTSQLDCRWFESQWSLFCVRLVLLLLSVQLPSTDSKDMHARQSVKFGFSVGFGWFWVGFWALLCLCSEWTRTHFSTLEDKEQDAL